MSAIKFRVLPRDQKAAAPPLGHWQKALQKALLVTVFAMPGMAVFLIFLLIPIGTSSRYSFYEWKGFGELTDENYIEYENYERLYEHEVFRQAVENTFTLMVLSLAVQLPLAFFLALLVGRGDLPGRHYFRTILFIPYVFSEIITALIFQYVFHPRDGLANVLLGQIIPNFERVAWLGERDLVLYIIFLVLTWKYFGFHMLLYMAGLQSVPTDLEEAARIDGATELGVLRFITIPLMGSTIRLTVFLSVLGSFQQFVLIFVLSGGGPFYASEVMATYLYKFGIQRLNLGYGSAIAVALFGMTLIFSLMYQRFVMRADPDVAR